MKKPLNGAFSHHFQAGREGFRQALSAAMPTLLTNGQKSPKDEVLTLAKGGNARNCKKTFNRIVERVGKLRPPAS